CGQSQRDPGRAGRASPHTIERIRRVVEALDLLLVLRVPSRIGESIRRGIAQRGGRAGRAGEERLAHHDGHLEGVIRRCYSWHHLSSATDAERRAREAAGVVAEGRDALQLEPGSRRGDVEGPVGDDAVRIRKIGPIERACLVDGYGDARRSVNILDGYRHVDGATPSLVTHGRDE